MEKHGVVYLIEDVAEMDQCQFVYPARNGGKPRRCKRDGKYRIGQTVFLCGVHMPGVGRCFRGGNPVVVESHLTPRAADGLDEEDKQIEELAIQEYLRFDEKE